MEGRPLLYESGSVSTRALAALLTKRACVDEEDDRNWLYSTKTTLINSAASPGTSVRLTSVTR